MNYRLAIIVNISMDAHHFKFSYFHVDLFDDHFHLKGEV